MHVHTKHIFTSVIVFLILIPIPEAVAGGSHHQTFPSEKHFLPFRLSALEHQGILQHPTSLEQQPKKSKSITQERKSVEDSLLMPADVLSQQRHKRKPSPYVSLQKNLDAHEGNVAPEWVQHSTQTPSSSTDHLNALAVDLSGNIYVTGTSEVTASGSDYLTIKYNSIGDSLWTRRFNGAGNGYDEATALCVDRSGNVYVTGYSFGGSSDYDYTTVKYDSNGAEQWVRTYDGADSLDIAIALALDPQEDVVVTGYSYSPSGDFDYVTVKYSPDGIEKWVKRYDGASHKSDQATALAIDGAGNIIVTGYSYHTGSDFDYQTLMYDSFGVEQWSAGYNGTSNSADIPTALALDSLNNVYVTGYSYQTVSGYNYLTIKYDHSGNRLWFASYNGPANTSDAATAIGIDRNQNIYVTGLSTGTGTLEDYCTVKYNQSGNELWNVRYSGVSRGSDVPTGLAIDSAGNSTITGYSFFNENFSNDFVTVKYDTLGKLLWTERYRSESDHDDMPAAVALDPRGDVIVAGSSVGADGSEDYAVVKYIQTQLGPWPVRYNKGADHNIPSVMATDHSGSVLVSGSDGIRFLTIKIDSLGILKWSALYGTAKSGVAGITADDSNNVYVTGYTQGVNGALDYGTVKYSQDGVQQWGVTYNGTGTGHDKAAGLVVDRGGNVYVTGTSFGNGSSNDYLTIKYNARGEQLWEARYNGSYNGNDEAVGIALDSAGNIVVAGTSVRPGSSYDFVTIKYSPDGATQWEAVYDGTGNGGDFVKALILDRQGNVYVTGRSFGGPTSSDFATVKYDANGNRLWIARYDGPASSIDDPAALAIDDSYNVYVAGSSYYAQTSSDFALVKYDRFGNQLWTARYGGTAKENDYASAVNVDHNNNVYITGTIINSASGSDYATIKYTSGGVQEWTEVYNGFANADDRASAMASDQRGYLYVAGSSFGDLYSQDYLIARYSFDNASLEHWPARYQGPGVQNDAVRAVALDRNGNVYTGGTTTTRFSLRDFAVSKFTSSGETQWNATYNDPNSDDDPLRAIAVDHRGNLFAGGTIYGSLLPTDFGFLKYTKDGAREWTTTYNDFGNDFDFLSGLTLDSSGNVYVCGYSGGHVPYHFTTMKYSADGVQQWVASYVPSADDDAFAYALTVDANGNTYVTGQSSGRGTGQDFTTVKYNSFGEQQWAIFYDGQFHGDDRAIAIAVDINSNIYVSGWSRGGDITYDYATIMYDSNGVEQWHSRFTGDSTTNDLPTAMCLDSSGNVYVTGASYKVNFENGDYVSVKYNNAGIEQWHVTYNGPGDGDDVPSSMAADRYGNIFVTGKSIGEDGTYDFATLKYDSNGHEQWRSRYSFSKNCDDLANSLALADDGTLYVAGTSAGAGWSIGTTIKYKQTALSVPETGASLPQEFSLEQNYPNPFNPSTTIRFEAPLLSHVVIEVFDILGRNVRTIADQTMEAGRFSVIWDGNNRSGVAVASGVYMVVMRATSSSRNPEKNYNGIKKMVLIR